MEFKTIIDPRALIAKVDNFNNFMDFLIEEIYNARENGKPKQAIGCKYDETVYMGDDIGYNITDGQIKKLKQFKQCFEDLPKKAWKVISSQIRTYIWSYNDDFFKKIDNWEDYKKGQNENDIRRRVIRRIEALREEVESLEEEYPNEWDRETYKDFEYYQLGSILDKFKEALTVEKYIPHLGLIHYNPNTMWIPPFKYFKAESENKKALHLFFKTLNQKYNLKCYDSFKRLVNSL